MAADCYVGAASGALKGIWFSANASSSTEPRIKNINAEKLGALDPTVDEITALCYVASTEQNQIITAHKDRHLRLFNVFDNTTSRLFQASGGNGPIIGVQAVDKDKIVVGVESGELYIWKIRKFDDEEVGKEETTLNEFEVKNSSDYLCTGEMNSGGNLCAIRSHPSKASLVASGGRENPLKIWDLEAGKAVFTAKNVRHDTLELRVPVWETNMRFLGGGDETIGGYCVATVTGHHQIRLYDTRVQRRPISELMWQDEPIMALSTCYWPNVVLLGNTRGEMGMFDLRFSCKQPNGATSKISLLKKFKGFAGSVRSIDAHPTAPIAASCSIDRYVIVHDLNTKAVLKKVFCKTQLNAILFCEDNSFLCKKEKAGDEKDENEDNNNKRKRRRRRADDERNSRKERRKDEDSDGNLSDLLED